MKLTFTNRLSYPHIACFVVYDGNSKFEVPIHMSLEADIVCLVTWSVLSSHMTHLFVVMQLTGLFGWSCDRALLCHFGKSQNVLLPQMACLLGLSRPKTLQRKSAVVTLYGISILLISMVLFHLSRALHGRTGHWASQRNWSMCVGLWHDAHISSSLPEYEEQ
jgi:hypothetical protein